MNMEEYFIGVKFSPLDNKINNPGNNPSNNPSNNNSIHTLSPKRNTNLNNNAIDIKAGTVEIASPNINNFIDRKKSDGSNEINNDLNQREHNKILPMKDDIENVNSERKQVVERESKNNSVIVDIKFSESNIIKENNNANPSRRLKTPNLSTDLNLISNNINNDNNSKCNNENELETTKKSKYNPNKTLKDYGELSIKEARLYDKRPFFQLLKDNLLNDHALANLILKLSIIESLWRRLVAFVFEFSIILFLNSIFFTDDLIDNRQF